MRDLEDTPPLLNGQTGQLRPNSTSLHSTFSGHAFQIHPAEVGMLQEDSWDGFSEPFLVWGGGGHFVFLEANLEDVLRHSIESIGD